MERSTYCSLIFDLIEDNYDMDHTIKHASAFTV